MITCSMKGTRRPGSWIKRWLRRHPHWCRLKTTRVPSFNFPYRHPAGLAWPPPERLPRTVGHLEDRSVTAQFHDAAAVEGRHQPERVNPGVGPLGAYPEQVKLVPTEPL